MVIFTRSRASMARLVKTTDTGTLPSEKSGLGSFCSYLGAVRKDEHKLMYMKLEY